MNDKSKCSNLSENRHTDAINPAASDRHLSKPRDKPEPLLKLLDATVAPERTVREYEALREGLPRTTVRPGVEGQGMFVLDDVAANSQII